MVQTRLFLARIAAIQRIFALLLLGHHLLRAFPANENVLLALQGANPMVAHGVTESFEYASHGLPREDHEAGV